MSYESADQIREQYGLEDRTLLDRLRENWEGYLFIIPTFVMFTALFYYPILNGIYMTFTDTRLGEPGQFVGLENYVWLINNDLFQFAFGWTLVFVIGTTGLQLGIGLVTALILSEISKYRKWLSAIVMSPYFSAPLAGGVIWLWFLDSSYGFLPRLIADMGMAAPNFLGEGLWPYLSLIVAQSWHDYGYAAIIYVAALTNIPSEQYEAAAMAGASRFKRFRDITLPHLITPTIIILALRTAYNVAEFAQPFELTGGGPGTKTMLLSILTYRVSYVNNNFGRGYTVGMAMIFISVVAAVFYVSVIKGEEELYV